MHPTQHSCNFEKKLRENWKHKQFVFVLCEKVLLKKNAGKGQNNCGKEKKEIAETLICGKSKYINRSSSPLALADTKSYLYFDFFKVISDRFILNYKNNILIFI